MATPATTATTTGKARSALEQARGEVPTTASKEAGEAEGAGEDNPLQATTSAASNERSTTTTTTTTATKDAEEEK